MACLKILQLNENLIEALPKSFYELTADVKLDWCHYISDIEEVKFLCAQTKNGVVHFLQAFMFANKLTSLSQFQ